MNHNKHHLWWNRSWYRTPTLRALRQHSLCMNELYVDVHKELHAELPPPPKPSPELAMGAIVLLDEMRNEGHTDPIDVHMALSEHFLGQDSNLSQRIGHHILHQAVFVQEGLYVYQQH